MEPDFDLQQWYDNDEFWQATMPLMFDEARWAGTPGEVDQVLALLNLDEGAAVLDLACGPGRHSLELARRGYRVTGIDRTAAYLAEARRRAAGEGLEIDFRQQDMRDALPQGTFDAAISLFTSFGYFLAAEENLNVLRNVYHSLRPGGRLLLQSHGKETLPKIFIPREWSEHGDTLWLEERTPVDNWNRIQARWILVRDGTRRDFHFTHWLYSGSELMAMLRQAGFASVELYGALDGRPYDAGARLLIALGRKA